MIIALRFGLCLAFVSFCLTNNARAQELDKSPSETNVTERVRLLESEIERQNSKLDQLQKTLLEQQQTIQSLLEKLSGQPVATAVSVKETETPILPEPQQAPTVEQRLTKLEGHALKIGPIRFSGEF